MRWINRKPRYCKTAQEAAREYDRHQGQAHGIFKQGGCYAIGDEEELVNNGEWEELTRNELERLIVS